jgi:hypothetical protein
MVVDILKKKSLVNIFVLIILILLFSTISSLALGSLADSDQLPEPVVLKEPDLITSSSITLSWTKSENDDFEMYKLYRDSKPEVNDSSKLITTINVVSTLTFLDSSLAPETTYFYRVYVETVTGLTNGSNMVDVTTLPASESPTAITLDQPYEITYNSITLKWLKSPDDDFKVYKLYRDTTSPVGGSSSLIATIYSQDVINFIDTGLAPDTTYHYRIYVVDAEGLTTGSNEVKGITLPQKFEANQSPLVDAGKNFTVIAEDTFELAGTGTDPDGIIVKYEWDFEGDGEFDWNSTNTGRVIHEYEDPGTYVAVLRVTDNDGLSKEDQVVIKVEDNNSAPGFEGGLLIFTIISLFFIIYKKRRIKFLKK